MSASEVRIETLLLTSRGQRDGNRGETMSRTARERMGRRRGGIRRGGVLLVVGCSALVVLAACGSAAGPEGGTSIVTARSFGDSAIGTSPPPVVPAENLGAGVRATPPTTPVPPSMLTVPDGVGLDYQKAQDLWRRAGLHVAPAVAATGAQRLPVIDSNWVVLSQDLAAGSTVPTDSFITATVPKLTDHEQAGDEICLRSR